MPLNGLICADVPYGTTYSLTQAVQSVARNDTSLQWPVVCRW